jgi:DNA repair exonuclease SbcCD ATPase subunit
MRIVYLKLVNFIGVKAATGLNEIEFKYDQIKQPIIQLYGRNRCGKTVMIQQHHPFSSINLTGDERNDLDLILEGETGLKNIVYEVNGSVLNITHTYRATGKNHTVSTSIVLNGTEMNPSGGVNTGNALIEHHLGINKYIFQFIINGTNLTSFSGMGATQRKQLLNKAMGIDIYDKIHKMATDDYRFTNKLIASLNHTKEYLLSTYGSYETLFANVDAKRAQRDKLEFELQQMKSNMDKLNGIIQTIQQQNPSIEMASIRSSIAEYERCIAQFGSSFDPNLADVLMEQQIQLNQKLSELNAKREILLKDVDDLYDKQHKADEIARVYRQSIDDKDALERTISSLKEKIQSLQPEPIATELTSNYMMAMLSLAQSINSICKEIVSSLKREHLEFIGEMVSHGIDVSAFLVKAGAEVLDTEKERSVITYIRSMMNSVDGELPDNQQCSIENCLYRRVYDAFDSYFKSFQSTTKGEYTQYDLEQMDHAYKNILSIKRMINIEISHNMIRDMFSIKAIMDNMLKYGFGINVDTIKHLIEETTKSEQRNQYIAQLHDSEQSLAIIQERLSVNMDISDTHDINKMIDALNQQIQNIDQDIQNVKTELSDTDTKRLSLNQIKRIDIQALTSRQMQLQTMIDKQTSAETEYRELAYQYQTQSSQYKSLIAELDVLEKAFDQYVKTSAEIEQNTSNDSLYKAIADATSSTKGIPVIAIRDTVERAIHTANQLLDVMYDKEIELLRPIIDESNFALPFRCGNNRSADIRYGSQSESTLLSLALSLSLSSSLTNFNIPLVDEIDAYLDISIRDDFILMLESMMAKLGMEQMFLISHNLQKGQYAHIVHTIDISEIIDQQKGGES